CALPIWLAGAHSGKGFAIPPRGGVTHSDLQLRAAGGGPIEVEEPAAGLIDAFVRVCAEIVALRLEQIVREIGGAVAVVIGQRGGEGGRGDPGLRGGGDDPAPIGLAAGEYIGEERVEEEVFQVRRAVVGLFDLLEEAGADDAPAAPDHGDRAEVEGP